MNNFLKTRALPRKMQHDFQITLQFFQDSFADMVGKKLYTYWHAKHTLFVTTTNLTSDFSSLFCASICVSISDIFVSNTIPPITISDKI